jgi:hypothetical protein
VVAALPVIMAQSVTAAATGGVAKATSAAKGISLLPLLVMWIGPIIGLMGGIFGTARSIQATQTPRERRFVVRMSIVVWIYVMAAMALLFSLNYFGRHFHWSSTTNVVMQCGFWLMYGIVLVWFVLSMNKRHQALRRAEGLTNPPPQPLTPTLKFGVIAATTAGSLAWVLALAFAARDWLGASATILVMIAIISGAFALMRRKSAPATARIFMWHTGALGLFTFLMVNWRFQMWLAATRGISIEEAKRRAPLWAMNLLLTIIWAFISSLMWATLGRRAKADPNCQQPAA